MEYLLQLCFVILLFFSPCYSLNASVINADFTSLVQSLNILNKTVVNLIQENSALKQDIAALKQDNAALKQDNAALKQDVASMKAEVASIAGDNVAFYARLSNHTTVSQDQIIRFDNVVTNVGNGYEPMIGHFTAPVKGIYMFSFSVMSTSGHMLHMILVKNGIEIARGEGEAMEYDTSTIVAIVTLNVGGLVWVSHHHGYSDNEPIYGSSWSSFCGSLIKKIN